ncbi:hypothetical protein GF373_03695 [bacterium]|nr:hypothetical protein [bacterium]
MISIITDFYLLIIALLTFFLPFWGSAVVLAVSTIETAYLVTHFGSHSIVHLTCMAFLLGSTAKAIHKKQINWDFAIPFILILLVEAFSIPFSLHPITAGWHALHMGAYALTAYFIAQSISYHKHIQTLIYILYGCLILSAALTFLQYLFQPNQTYFHGTGGFFDWNFYPIFLMSLVPFIAHELKKPLKPNTKVFFISLMTLAIILILASNSRTGLLIMLFGLSLLFPTGLIDKKYLPWLIPVFLIGLYLFSQILGHYSLSLTEKIGQWISSERLQERFYTQLFALETFAKHPLLGVGSGQLEQYFHWLHPQTVPQANGTVSTLPVILGELGIFGGIAYAYLIVALFKGILGTGLKNQINKTVIISIITVIFASLFHTIHSQMYIWCFIGLLFGYINTAKDNQG